MSRFLFLDERPVKPRLERFLLKTLAWSLVFICGAAYFLAQPDVRNPERPRAVTMSFVDGCFYRTHAHRNVQYRIRNIPCASAEVLADFKAGKSTPELSAFLLAIDNDYKQQMAEYEKQSAISNAQYSDPVGLIVSRVKKLFSAMDSAS